MRPVTLPGKVVAVFAMALAAASCAGGSGGAGGGGADVSPVPATNAATAALLPTNAVALPEFDLASYQELLGQLRGTPVVVNVWGSWCGPCRDEAPTLAAAQGRYGDRVQFLGVDILDARQSARGFMHEYGWRYPSLYDPSGAIRDGLGLLGQPVTLFYAADGHLVGRWLGPIPRDELGRRIDGLLAV